jgi:imidazole glycerol-phosphate synthase subunit HisH
VVDVTIVDCGIGNVKSVLRMFEWVDASAEIVSDPREAAKCSRLVLPGVGAFDAGMAALNRGWRQALDHVALEQKAPVLGICLGMQLLCRRSEEGQASGLGWIEADVTRLDTSGDPRLKVPHMGWAVVTAEQPNPLIPSDEGEQRFYHVHSYRAVCANPEDVIGTANYGTEFTTAVRHGNIFGVQFHPEKSHLFGMALMRRFAALPC